MDNYQKSYHRTHRYIHNYLAALLLLLSLIFCGCSAQDAEDALRQGAELARQAEKLLNEEPEQEYGTIDLENIPEFDGEEAYIEINDNMPYFYEEDLTTEPFEEYSELDGLGRCGTAYANICQELMPTGKRESISRIKPSGWRSVKYKCVDGRYLYNRCHLIGYQLAGENANEKNLITGTRYMNVEGMLPFENMVADYVEETDNHVLYRVTPIYAEDNLVAEGVQMEAYSVEDDGEGICYNVYVYNEQPGVEINHETGESHLEF